MSKSRKTRAQSRGATLVELAAMFAVGGSLLAVAIPSFAKHLSSSRLVEPVDGLARLGEGAKAYAEAHPNDAPFPQSAPLTPTEVPRGVMLVDAPGTWDTPTWRALDFRFEDAHRFSFAFDSTLPQKRSATGASFVATAHGDLDGDGVTSTFEIRGHADDAHHTAVLDPGMHIDSEFE
jgi:hypothetical protein